jgi:hypothetical protein
VSVGDIEKTAADYNVAVFASTIDVVTETCDRNVTGLEKRNKKLKYTKI